ncbi:Lrp/AsnC family transcriptional regulator [Paracoccus subflavus]|uniref:Lrp/AsnC family transcriptional regulator n=1 Tax=Paracoccus subflavus TaxID=2528244 RepID=A0A4Q9G4I7_9RHOB|nr:Lrp/AsnC family transcriptional regulator [Paracoccus subflavus]TBN39527.1 Lrp/AsnC family transcriptional regulator [Paracoccus subflavus]
MENPTIDEFDLRILRALSRDGRMSIHALSVESRLSPTPVARRLKRLESSGIVTGFAALIDEEKLGFGVSVFVSVRLDRQIDEALAVFEAAIETLPEVVDCWLMTGNRDYLLRVVTRSMREFEIFLVQQLTRIKVVAAIESSIPLRRVKAGRSRML